MPPLDLTSVGDFKPAAVPKDGTSSSSSSVSASSVDKHKRSKEKRSSSSKSKMKKESKVKKKKTKKDKLEQESVATTEQKEASELSPIKKNKQKKASSNSSKASSQKSESKSKSKSKTERIDNCCKKDLPVAHTAAVSPPPVEEIVASSADSVVSQMTEYTSTSSVRYLPKPTAPKTKKSKNKVNPVKSSSRRCSEASVDDGAQAKEQARADRERILALKQSSQEQPMNSTTAQKALSNQAVKLALMNHSQEEDASVASSSPPDAPSLRRTSATTLPQQPGAYAVQGNMVLERSCHAISSMVSTVNNDNENDLSEKAQVAAAIQGATGRYATIAVEGESQMIDDDHINDRKPPAVEQQGMHTNDSQDNNNNNNNNNHHHKDDDPPTATVVPVTPPPAAERSQSRSSFHSLLSEEEYEAMVRERIVKEAAQATVVRDEREDEERRSIHSLYSTSRLQLNAQPNRGLLESLFGRQHTSKQINIAAHPDCIVTRQLIPYVIKRNRTTNTWITEVLTIRTNGTTERVLYSTKTKAEAIEVARCMAPPMFLTKQQSPPTQCHICSSSFTKLRNRAIQCRNCGVYVCGSKKSACSTTWNARMLPSTYHGEGSTKSVTVCGACEWLSQTFQTALRNGNLQEAICVWETGNLNIRQPCCNIANLKTDEVL